MAQKKTPRIINGITFKYYDNGLRPYYYCSWHKKTDNTNQGKRKYGQQKFSETDCIKVLPPLSDKKHNQWAVFIPHKEYYVTFQGADAEQRAFNTAEHQLEKILKTLAN